MNLQNTFFETFFEIWKSSQIDLSKVERWKPYYTDGIGKNMRRQNVLQHTISFSLFAGTVSLMLDPYVREQTGKHLDLLLLEHAFKWHDYAEGLNGKDIISPKKTDEDDVFEYIAFMDAIKDFPLFVKEKYQYAFLLQFALNGNKMFPEEVQEIFQKIHDKNFYDALTFQAFEKFEYLFYPFEMEHEHKYLLYWVIKRQLPDCQKFIQKLPGFREVLFPESLEIKFYQYLNEHKDVPKQVI